MNLIDVVAKFVSAVLSPLGTALVLAVLAMLLSAIGRRRLAFGMSAFAIGWLTLWSLPLASIWLRQSMEGQPSDGFIEELPTVQAIVVLGGGISPQQVPGSRPNLTAAVDRIWYGASLYHAGKAPVVVLSGGSDPQTTLTTEAVAMDILLRDLGVPDAAVLLETRSRTTQQNARFTAELLQERGISHILLVTSALHMRRATERFQAEGLTVTPAPTDYEARTMESWRRWIPDTDALDGSAQAIKEIVGRMVGR